MRYESTRGKVKGASLQDVLMAGYAQDGGLFVPEVIPILCTEELQQYSSLDYADLCREIVKKFVSDEEYQGLCLHELIGEAFATFDCKEVVLVKKIGDLFISELWHGETMAFKDLGISCLSRFTERILKQQSSHANLICATSGDTGSAVMEGVKGSEFIDVFTMFPEGRCSDIQERQMICIENENVHAFSSEGTSDDFDVVLQQIFDDKEFCENNGVMVFNSINWIRILIQIVHYFFSYFRATEFIGELVTIVVPSGGLGNLSAGYIATAMGLPVKLVAAVNQNGATHNILSTGIWKEPKEVLRSSSCSMDIAVPYNMERILYIASKKDDTISRMMKDFKERKSVEIDVPILNKVRETIQTATVPEEDVKAAILESWNNHHYHVEPHTAVGVAVALNPERYGVKIYGEKTVCLSCASAQKFLEIFKELGIPLEPTEKIKHLLTKQKRFLQLRKGENWAQVLKESIVKATDKFNKLHKK